MGKLKSLTNKSKNNLINKQLILAAMSGNVNGVKEALAKGADVNSRGDAEDTALIVASYYKINHPDNYQQIVKLLLNAGANVNAQDQFGNTAILFAARSGHLEIVEILLQAGADIFQTSKNGKTALSLSKERNHSEITTLLENAIKDIPVIQKNVDILFKAKKYNNPPLSTLPIDVLANIAGKTGSFLNETMRFNLAYTLFSQQTAKTNTNNNNQITSNKTETKKKI